jgi:hypothetical protein
VARVKDCSQTDTGLEGLDDVVVDLVIDNVAVLLEIDRVDDFVVTVFLVAVGICGLAAVACTG